MFNFRISVPTELCFGARKWEKTGDLMRQYADNILLLYGSERIFESGFGAKLVASLEDACCKVVRCGGVPPNTDSAYIEAVIQCAREQKINGILAVGGGSVIDSAKAVALGACAERPIIDVLDSGIQDSCVLPVGAVVTMPASGSEANGGLVIMDHKTGMKHFGSFDALKPKFAILDPELTCSVPANQTAFGGVDMFSHAFERYFDTTRESVLLDEQALAIMKTVVRILPQVLKTPEDVSLRSELMLAATMAHSNMIGPGGDFACHGISHHVTHHYGLAHGAALAVIMPAWCKAMESHDPERFRYFYQEVFHATPEEGASAFKDFIASLGLAPILSGTKDTHAQFLKDLQEGAPLGKGNLQMSPEEIEAICQLMW